MINYLKIGTLAGLLLALCLPSRGENYQSQGFTAQITNNGTIQNLAYAGKPLAANITLTGSYYVPAGMEKHDARFFQSWDYAGRAKFNRDGEKLTVTMESTLSSKVFKNAVDYKMICTMEPAKITLRYEVTSKVELSSDYRLFMTHIFMTPELFGRGMRVLQTNGQEEFMVIPETYNAKFRVPDSPEIGISTGKITLGLKGGEGTTFSYMDCRSWGGKDFVLIANPPGKWTPKPVAHPAGSQWKWEFTITAIPD